MNHWINKSAELIWSFKISPFAVVIQIVSLRRKKNPIWCITPTSFLNLFPKGVLILLNFENFIWNFCSERIYYSNEITEIYQNIRSRSGTVIWINVRPAWFSEYSFCMIIFAFSFSVIFWLFMIFVVLGVSF